MKPPPCGLAVLTLALVLIRPLQAQYNFSPVDVPGANTTYALGLNDAAQVVGVYEVGNTSHAFLLSDGEYRTIDVPGASRTEAYGINNSGQIVGWYIVGNIQHGFLLSDGEYSTIDVPGASYTTAYGINDAGQIVGSYAGGHGFELSEGEYTEIQVPGANGTFPRGINNAGQVVGFYTKPGDGKLYGFLLSDGEFTPIDFPGAVTTVFGINDTGLISGEIDDAPGGMVLCGARGLLRSSMCRTPCARLSGGSTTPANLSDGILMQTANSAASSPRPNERGYGTRRFSWGRKRRRPRRNPDRSQLSRKVGVHPTLRRVRPQRQWIRQLLRAPRPTGGARR
jgi:probable HAF family extracellular repeat protein